MRKNNLDYVSRKQLYSNLSDVINISGKKYKISFACQKAKEN